MRTVFLGTSAFAATVLGRLAESEHRPALAVTRPDRRRGRGRRLAPPPVAEAARAAGIDVAQPGDVNSDEARGRIAAAAPETVCVCAFGALIREPLLSTWPMLNVHPSLLPRWRGAAPIERAIIAGDGETGVSIMRVTAGLDSGPVCLRRAEPIEAGDGYGDLAPRLARIGGDALVEVLSRAQRGELRCAEQDEGAATYADKIEAADRELDTARPAAELERVVRALTPHVGARTRLPGGGWLGVTAARAARDRVGRGELVADSQGRLLLGCAGGALALTAVQPPGGRTMPAADYLRGHPLTRP